MTGRYFEFKDNNSNKFWTAEISGTSVNVSYGKIGTDGQKQVKEFSSKADAAKFLEKKINEKLREGYVEKKEKSSSKNSKKKSTKFKIEQISRENIEKLCSFMASSGWEELTDSAYMNGLNFLGIEEPDGFDYTDGDDGALYGEVESAVQTTLYLRLLFLAIYNPAGFYDYVAEQGKPYSEIITFLDDLSDDADDEDFDEWFDNMSDQFG